MLSYDRRGDAAWITIDRPEKRNAIHVEGWRELARLLERAEAEARAAVLTGVGDAFCAGDDIEVIDGAETAAEVEELGDCLHEALFGVEKLDVPVIAAVNGLAYGGGMELVVGCDLAVAVEGATFALPETRIGAYPPYAVERVAAVGGRKRLMELSLTGEPIDADRALDWGLVNRVVPEWELEPTVETFVERIAESPAASIATAKRHAARSASDAGARDRVVGALSQLRRDDDCRDATRAFLER
ncbi:enoyl-CoA hydratase/isomerase family protein [Halegenticoccus tardaugens]|uniref:enoyl-CoA hydratase/isomerase family protein n=1 Tax=Halegenticoccus tardaugens TaxID=2071624 RepID=UPI00100BBBC8|nr:enoyl-CoA hydratase/isomerase family protein [Halegenticoccus tardaugens]